MKRVIQNKRPNMDAAIRVRMTVQLYDDINNKADRNHMRLPQYVRKILSDDVQKKELKLSA